MNPISISQRVMSLSPSATIAMSQKSAELRAKGIARHVGLPNVSGISAKSDPVLFVHFCVRECFAILKDKFVGNM